MVFCSAQSKDRWGNVVFISLFCASRSAPLARSNTVSLVALLSLLFLFQDEDISETGEDALAARAVVKSPDQLRLTEAVSKAMPVLSLYVRCVPNSINRSLPIGFGGNSA